MEQDKRIAFALDQLKGRLHSATGDKRCGCGPCRHWVGMAAKAAGVSPERLESHLPPPAKPGRHRCRPRPMTSRIGESGSGIDMMLRRLHQEE
ncbi:hypothetical protein L2K20_20555 [Mycobacterium sp. MBM]|nr:hypothetical protein [Mycobacterium sp. MBM]